MGLLKTRTLVTVPDPTGQRTRGVLAPPYLTTEDSRKYSEPTRNHASTPSDPTPDEFKALLNEGLVRAKSAVSEVGERGKLVPESIPGVATMGGG